MTLLLVAAVLLGAGPATAAPEGTAEDGPTTCTAVLAHLEKAHASLKEIPLEKNPHAIDDDGSVGEDCPDFGEVKAVLRRRQPAGAKVETGTLGRRRAAVQRVGPAGSGRFWDVTIAVEGDRGPVGACLTTSTVGMRTASRVRGRLPGKWEAFQGGRLVLWTSIPTRDGGGPGDAVLVPVHHTLAADTLRLDPEATARAVGEFGKAYATCSDTGRERWCRDVLVPAAQAFVAWAAGRPCPPR